MLPLLFRITHITITPAKQYFGYENSWRNINFIMSKTHTMFEYNSCKTKIQKCHWSNESGSSNYEAWHSYRLNKAWRYSARLWKKVHPISNKIRFHNQPIKPQSSGNLVMHLQSKRNIHGNKILPIRHTDHKKLQKSVLSDHALYLRSGSIRYMLARQWYHKISTDAGKIYDSVSVWIQ